MGTFDQDHALYCKSCRRKFKDKPPCEACDWASPKLLPENEDAFFLFKEIKTQWRAAGFGLIGLDYNVLYQEGERLGVDLSPCVMKKIKACEAAVLAKQREGESDGSKT